ncbi:hypothetical protein [Sphingobium sp. EM0848]|uniref:hypothetical protein n=1 Tax=Sphingobium sp. EM0848 TaxID=2743473 RepID=UPI00159C19AE|nr:hypothetical protein [Sphingobium sp. EM0848]
MKKLMIGAIALAALNVAPAMAQQQDFAVSGSVSATCSAITTSAIGFGTIGISASTGKLNSGQSASSTATPIWCNGVASTLSFSGANSNTIHNSKSTTDAAFTSDLTYTPKVTLGGSPVTSGATIGAVAANLVVTADTLTSPGDKLPVAGDYSGTITVTLTPGV